MKKSTYIPYAISFFLLLFSTLAIISVWYKQTTYSADVLITDLANLGRIFTRINSTAQIASFDHQKNWINFLQIKRDGFVGSEVGSMNLVYPDKWEGPYINDNLTFQSKEYQVIRTKQGYFIVPGDGVRLPNNKRVGKDIVLDENADIFALMKDTNGLQYKGSPLAIKIAVGAKKESVKGASQ
jgi:hypothetical protein